MTTPKKMSAHDCLLSLVSQNISLIFKWFGLILFSFLLAPTSNAQLVNIETKRMQTDSNRFVLDLSANFNYTNQNGRYIYNAGSSLTTQLKSKDLNKIFLIIGNYNLIRAEERDFQNNYFGHVRYNQELTRLFRIEAFVQHQTNELLIINSRSLIGGGPRLKLISRPQFRAYWGNAVMYESEISDQANSEELRWRHSTYLSFTWSSENGMELTNTAYFQPLYTHIANFRILEQLRFETPITKRINFTTTFNYFVNSKTPLDTNDETSSIKFGLTFKIG